MTDNQKHAARLREMSLNARALADQWAQYGADADALLAGAKALEGQGRWRLTNFGGQLYLIPAERKHEWMNFRKEVEAGEYTAIVPEWALAVPDNVVITGVELL